MLFPKRPDRVFSHPRQATQSLPPDRSGIYVMRDKETDGIVYIGQSVNLRSRLRRHPAVDLHAYHLRPAPTIEVYFVEAHDLNYIEGILIRAYDPPYNSQCGGSWCLDVTRRDHLLKVTSLLPKLFCSLQCSQIPLDELVRALPFARKLDKQSLMIIESELRLSATLLVDDEGVCRETQEG